MRFENKGSGPKGGSFLVCDGVKRGLGCCSIRWRYDEFEASFLAFVRELDLAALLTAETKGRDRAAIDDEIRSLEGELKAKQIEQEKAYELYQVTGPIEFVAQKLKDISNRMLELKSLLETKHKIKSSTTAEANRFYESKEQIQSLLNRFTSRVQDEDVYKLRSQVASRLRSIVEFVLVASSGSAPFVAAQIEVLKKRRPAPKKIVSELSRALSQKDTLARYFTVRFKDGTIRGVMPKDSDPLNFQVQILGTDDDLKRIDARGAIKKLTGFARTLG